MTGGIVIFGGTTEGRILTERYLSEKKQLTVCVTSEYARNLLPEGVDCRVGVMDENAMQAFLKERKPEKIIDATHPYAVRVTKNIAGCAEKLNIPLERVQRPEDAGDWRNATEIVSNAGEAAVAAASAAGNVMLTTGSHTLDSYAQSISPERLYVRVLPTEEALRLCREAGIIQSHIIAMHGPFSEELNAALYDQLDIRVMVTKDSGKAGGVEEKVRPALERGIHVVLIARPDEKKQ